MFRTAQRGPVQITGRLDSIEDPYSVHFGFLEGPVCPVVPTQSELIQPPSQVCKSCVCSTATKLDLASWLFRLLTIART